MQQTLSETQAVPRVTFVVDDRRSIRGEEFAVPDHQPMLSDALAAPPAGNTQCFMCSRIYFDQNLRKCPRCNSESLQHYSTADLSHFARGPE